ncbi:MAG: AMP-binding protein [Gammaproteobacteria bacterium]|nr:AMP-binding protein [Gammaproteobacteria bacterium]
MTMIEKLSEELRPEKFSKLSQVIDYFCSEHAQLPAFTSFGRTLDYSEVNELSDRFAHYLITQTNLKPGDRIAIQLPNILQFPIAFYGATRAGLIVVNTNPLYTAQEMVHQFKDSGVTGIVILANFCDKLEKILPETAIETVIVTQLGDVQKPFKRHLINFAMKYIRKLVPAYSLNNTIDFQTVINAVVPKFDYPEAGQGDDIALILYTGGTTGFAKGAMLSHNNLIANMMQLRSRCLSVIEDRIESILAPLPMYHSYAFLLHCLMIPYGGNHSILVANPRDIAGLIKLFKERSITGLVGINTLYLALLRHENFSSIDFSAMKFCGAGGMATTTSVSEEWTKATGSPIYEGYGLTECSPVVAITIPGKERAGTVGPVVPETETKVMSDEGVEVATGERGELWVRGPQVMQGYWQHEEETAEALTTDGWFKTGDYVEISDDGYVSIVDRKKDMILVSGFNVFPNEIEDWVNRHPDVLECAAVGIPSEKTGESIRLFVVPSQKDVDIESVRAHCKEGLTAYKLPREFVLIEGIPKSIIGKILHRELRKKI